MTKRAHSTKLAHAGTRKSAKVRMEKLDLLSKEMEKIYRLV